MKNVVVMSYAVLLEGLDSFVFFVINSIDLSRERISFSQVAIVSKLALDRFFFSLEMAECFNAIALLPNRLSHKTLGEVLRLDQYDLSSAIPGLTSTPLGKFLGWQQSFVSGVPLLNKIGFGSFPIPISFNLSAVAIVDWLDTGYINPTLSDDGFVSGSGKNGVNKPMRCPITRTCERIELSSFIGSLDPNYGKKWVVGNQQQVPGGEGILGVIAGGFEPTGRILFSPAFKVILMDIDQATSTATFGINFRFCVRGMTNLGCTPYKFGTIPLFTVKEGDLILL